MDRSFARRLACRLMCLFVVALALATAIRAQAQQTDIAAIHNRIWQLYAAGNYSAALQEARRFEAAVKAQFGANHEIYAVALNDLATVYAAQGKYGEAEGFFRRALAIEEEALGSEHADLAPTLQNLANVLYLSQGKHGEAEPLYRRALAIVERERGPDHPNVAPILNNLGSLYKDEGKYDEAKDLFQRSLAIREKAFGRDHPDVASSLNNLASVAPGEAEGLLKRALAIKEKALGRQHPDVALTLVNLAGLYRDAGKYGEAERLYERALAIYEKTFGRDHPDVAETLDQLAKSYTDQGQNLEAEELLQRALAIREKALGREHPRVASTLTNLADVRQSQGKSDEAERLYQRALAIHEKAFGRDHPNVARSLDDLASHYAYYYGAVGRRDDALAYSRRATAAVIAHAAVQVLGTQVKEDGRKPIEQGADYFYRHVANLAALARGRSEVGPMLAREAFEIAQWSGHSSAATALDLMATRFGSGTDMLARLIREKQDLAAAWSGMDKALLAALSKPEGRQNRAAIESLRKRMAEIEARVAAIAAQLEREFPNYQALARTHPLKVEEVQQLLGADEALVFWIVGRRESYVFALTREGFEWRTIERGQKLSDAVSRVMRSVRRRSEAFDLAAAHEVYRFALGPIAESIKHKSHWIMVPAAPLAGLPFQMLLAEAPTRETTTKTAHWLIRDHAVSLLPAVSSLRALRKVAAGKARTASLPFIGFGDPQIGDRYGRVASCAQFEARARGGASIEMASAADADAVRAPEVDGRALVGGGFSDGGLAIANVDYLRRLAPLPESRCEVEALARARGEGSQTIVGAAATEAKVKELSAAGELKKYRVIAFATHGLLPGEAEGLGEGGLVLTREGQRRR